MIHPPLKDMSIGILAGPMLSHRDTEQHAHRANQTLSAVANATSKTQPHRLLCTLTDNNPTEQLKFVLVAKDSSMP
jgi:hypothetical protein